jgi:hypothetical protein
MCGIFLLCLSQVLLNTGIGRWLVNNIATLRFQSLGYLNPEILRAVHESV